jgi:metal-responsive CopG/Arc/MetJ family transcriptional regulator
MMWPTIEHKGSDMSSQPVGRPPKSEQQRRQQLQISLYSDDIERLGQLTENRSEFIRQCIAQSWAEKYGAEQTITLTLPKRLVAELATVLQQRLPPDRAALLSTLVDELLVDDSGSE